MSLALKPSVVSIISGRAMSPAARLALPIWMPACAPYWMARPSFMRPSRPSSATLRRGHEGDRCGLHGWAAPGTSGRQNLGSLSLSSKIVEGSRLTRRWRCQAPRSNAGESDGPKLEFWVSNVQARRIPRASPFCIRQLTLTLLSHRPGLSSVVRCFLSRVLLGSSIASTDWMYSAIYSGGRPCSLLPARTKSLYQP